MKETLLEILMMIFNQIIEDEAVLGLDAEQLLEKLENMGAEITESTPPRQLTEAQGKLVQAHYQNFGDNDNIRILSPDEAEKLGVEGWNYLLSLENADIIPPWIRELILYEIENLELDDLDLKDLKMVIFHVMRKLINKEEDVAWLEHLLFYSNDQRALH